MLPAALALVLVSALAGPALARPPPCKFTTASGSSFDLSALAGVHELASTRTTPPTEETHRVRMILCAANDDGDDAAGAALPREEGVAEEDQCPVNTLVCLQVQNSKPSSDPPVRTTAVVPIVVSAPSAPPPAVNWTYALVPRDPSNTDPKRDTFPQLTGVLGGGTYPSGPQALQVELGCTDAEHSMPEPQFVSYKDNTLLLRWSTQHACARSADDNDGGKQADGGGVGDAPPGRGFWGWLFILLLIVPPAYLALGIYYNRTTYAATGWDAVPHRAFWEELPGNVKELVGHVCGGTRPKAMADLPADERPDRAPSPGFPSPSSSLVPPPSAAEELERVRGLDVDGAARRARRNGDGAGGASGQSDAGGPDGREAATAASPEKEEDGRPTRPARPSSAPASADADLDSSPSTAPVGTTFTALRAGAPASAPPPPPLADPARASTPEAATPAPAAPASPAAAGPSAAPARSPSVSSPRPDPIAAMQASKAAAAASGPSSSSSSSASSKRMSQQACEHPGRPLDLGTSTSHTARHPGTIMYPEPSDPVRPSPGDRSRPSQDRVHLMHDTIDARDRAFKADDAARERRDAADERSKGERVRAREAEKDARPQIVVRDFAFARADARFAGNGPLRASLLLLQQSDEVSSDAKDNHDGGARPGWGFGGWKADGPGQEDEDDWHDYGDEEEDDDDDDGYAHGGGQTEEEDTVEPGVYRALYAFQAEAPAELSLAEHDVVRVHRSGGVGWAVGTLLDGPSVAGGTVVQPGREGLVPRGYLERVRD